MRQKRIMDQAGALVKSGGFLITYLYLQWKENEDMIPVFDF